MTFRRFILVAMAAAALLRGGRALLCTPVIEVDGTEYARLAENLRDGVGYTGMLDGRELMFPPLYPLLIAGVSGLTGLDAVGAGRLVSVLAGTLLLIPVALILRRLVSERAGRIGAALAALHLPFVLSGAAVFVEAVFLLLFAFAVWATGRLAEAGRGGYAALAGGIFGFAHLARHDGFFLAILCVGAALLCLARTGAGLRRVAAAGFIAALSFAVVVAPYAAWLAGVTGSVRLEAKSGRVIETAVRTGRGLSYAEANYGLDADGTEGPWLRPNVPRTGETGLLEALRRDPVALGRNVLRNAWREVRVLLTGQMMLSPVLLLLAVLGLRRMAAGPGPAAMRTGLVLGAVYALAAAALYKVVLRYLIVPSFAALVLGAGAIGSRTRTLRSAVLVGAIALISVGRPLATGLSEYDEGGRGALPEARAGAWLRGSGGAGPWRIAGTSSVVAYYAGAAFVPLPVAPEDRVTAWLRARDVTHVVVRARGREREGRPALAAWYRPADAPPYLRLIHEDGGILLYAFE